MFSRVVILTLLVSLGVTQTTSMAAVGWLELRPVRSIQVSDIASDVDAHVGRSFGDSGPTRVHEDTHKINSEVRNRYGSGTGSYNAIYCGRNRVYILPEPAPIKLDYVARSLPASLRGSGYQLYLLDMQRDWNNTPLYIMDEWSAYINTAQYHVETGLGAASDMQQAMECMGYSVQLLIIVESHKLQRPDWRYKPEWLRPLVKYQAERVSRIYMMGMTHRPNDMAASMLWLYRLQSSKDTAMMRSWLRYLYGKEWCRRFFGIL